MLKRKPTRIELRAEDALEYDEMQRNKQAELDAGKTAPLVGPGSKGPSGPQSSTRDRIGYKGGH